MKFLFCLSLLCIILCANFKAQAQDWDDFDPPPPTEYGGPQSGGMAAPPSPPSFDSPAPVWDNSVNNQAPPSRSSGGSSPGPIVFKKTGKQKDLTKKNPRKEELLKENP